MTLTFHSTGRAKITPPRGTTRAPGVSSRRRASAIEVSVPSPRSSLSTSSQT